jgi:hypothetical protein
MIDLGPGAPGGGETNRFTVVCPYSNSDKQNSQHPMGEKNKQGDRDPSVGGGSGCNNPVSNASPRLSRMFLFF